MKPDTRWKQRFKNYLKAFSKLKEAVDSISQNKLDGGLPPGLEAQSQFLSEMFKEGLIQRFEYTHELAWNVMKDYAHFQGDDSVGGSRDATRSAFQLKLITDGKIWMDMIGSRNKTSHTYNQETAEEIYEKIVNDYYPAFVEFKNVMEEKKSGNQSKLF